MKKMMKRIYNIRCLNNLTVYLDLGDSSVKISEECSHDSKKYYCWSETDCNLIHKSEILDKKGIYKKLEFYNGESLYNLKKEHKIALNLLF